MSTTTGDSSSACQRIDLPGPYDIRFEGIHDDKEAGEHDQ